MIRPVRRLVLPDETAGIRREWLVTNGLGGYASGTVSGRVTRRYHGLLVAALPAPVGRMVMLSHVDARVHLGGGRTAALEAEPSLPVAVEDPESPHRLMKLAEFRLETGMPVWRYEHEGVAIEKRVLMPYRQNTVHLSYRLLDSAGPVQLELRPFLHVRHYDDPILPTSQIAHALTATGGRFEIAAGSELPILRLLFYGHGSALTVDASQLPTGYPEEQSRGYEDAGTLWTPGFFHIDLGSDGGPEGTLVASTEPWETIEALTPGPALDSERARLSALLEHAGAKGRPTIDAELIVAADQFVITPAARPEDATRAMALGTEARSVIAGYHWFTDWGRDTMIGLEGLTLETGRSAEAGLILRTFASYVRDGLIPNMFPDGERQGLYHTADASLWFFHAVGRYVAATDDLQTLRILLPALEDMMAHHLRGTRFGIRVDPEDGLLTQGEDGYQLTWMDAKVGDWVVTPRRGKAVEINALYYNALRLLEDWVRNEHGEARAQPLADHAARARASFNRRFWHEEAGYLYDVVDGPSGDDPACRPNQVFALSLTHPVLDSARWEAVVEAVRQRLLTPYGLRSLAPDHPDYCPKYYGDLRARDAAYHQGTVWAWLIGPFVDAWLRVHPADRLTVGQLLEGFDAHLSQAGVGSISEIFDAEPPYTPRGCIAQAWSVAEVLRARGRLRELS
jgi:glycogen debranching enzyme